MLCHFRDEMLYNEDEMTETGDGANRLDFVTKAKESLIARSHAVDVGKLRYQQCGISWRGVA